MNSSKGMIMCKFGHFKEKDQSAINDEYQQDFPDDEKEFNDLIMIPFEDLKTSIKDEFLGQYIKQDGTLR